MVYYKTNYDTSLRRPTDTLIIHEKWKILTNDFSIYQFPDAKNQQQFIKLGLMVQNLLGEFASGKKTFFNTAGHAEYRNKSRNQQWDIEAFGKLYFTGLNSGDFEAHISLQKLLGKKIGSLQLGFENTNRTPSFIFDRRSSFYLNQAIDQLLPDDATIITMFYQGEQSLEEIARALGMETNTVKVKLHRARHRLKEKLERILNHEIKELL